MVSNRVDSQKISAFKLFLATLGGGDRNILGRAGVDGTRLAGRGIAAIIPALFGAAAVCIAFRYAFDLSLAGAALAGLIWGGIVLCFDLSLMTHGSDGRLLGRVAGFGLRAIVAVLAAFTFASPIVIWMFSSDIAVRVAADQQNGLASYNSGVIAPKYAPKVAKDNAAIKTYQGQLTSAAQSVASAQQAVQKAQTALTCEGQGVQGAAGCGSGTGKYGQGPVYQVRLTELTNAQANLKTAQATQQSVDAQVGPELTAAKTDLATLNTQQKTDYTAAQARYSSDDGLIARWTALNELEASSATVRMRAWGLEALIVAIDLSAVIARMVTTTPSYDEIVKLERAKVRHLAADEDDDYDEHMLRRRTNRQTDTAMENAWHDARLAVERENAAAWAEVQRRKTRAWVASETGEPWGGEAGEEDLDDEFERLTRDSERLEGDGAEAGAFHGAPVIDGPDLGTFAANMQAHEHMAVRFHPRSAQVAWVGVGLLGVLTALLLLLRMAGSAVTGDWLALLALAAAVGMAVYTRGFRRGPAWTHHAGFAVGLLVIPVAAMLVLLSL